MPRPYSAVRNAVFVLLFVSGLYLKLSQDVAIEGDAHRTYSELCPGLMDAQGTIQFHDDASVVKTNEAARVSAVVTFETVAGAEVTTVAESNQFEFRHGESGQSMSAGNETIEEGVTGMSSAEW
jgi:hypothetical protein